MPYTVKAFLFSTDGLYSALLVDREGQCFLAGSGRDEPWELTRVPSLAPAIEKYGFTPLEWEVPVQETDRQSILIALEEAAQEHR